MASAFGSLTVIVNPHAGKRRVGAEVHEVVNGMMDEGKPVAPDAVLGVVAAGSGCDFVRTFGLPGDVTRSCQHLLGENTYPLDIGMLTYTDGGGEPATRYFPNV